MNELKDTGYEDAMDVTSSGLRQTTVFGISGVDIQTPLTTEIVKQCDM